MCLVSVTFIAQTYNIVRESSHGEVVGADDALVVVAQCHTSHLCEESVLGCHLRPALIEFQGRVATGSPDSLVLYHSMELQALTLVVYIQSKTS